MGSGQGKAAGKGQKRSGLLAAIEAPVVYSRRLTGHRDNRRALRAENAREAIGDLYPGCEIYGFTKGQFCLIHILEHCLNQVKTPAKVDIATWSAASGDIQAAYRMVRLSQIERLRFVVDFSFQSRKPQFCAELIEAFGEDCIRVTAIHAKFMTIQAGDWNLVIRTSMNLNYNPRFENFEISDDAGMLRFMSAIVDEIWDSQEVGQGFTNRPYDNRQQFAKLGSGDDAGPVLLEPMDLEHIEGLKL